MWPGITVVTPSYNQGQFIEETIRSVLLQGYPNLQYFVIDGCSNDNTVEVIRKYEDKISFWASERDEGQSHAINKGFARASGDIWCWVNSDDMLAEGTLFKAAAMLRGKTRALLVGTAIEGEFLAGREGNMDARKPSWPEMKYRARTFPQPSVFWTRDLAECSLLNGSLLDNDLHLALDLDLWLRMRPNVKDLVFLGDVLSYERVHPAQKAALRTYKAEQFIRERDYACLRASILRRRLPVRWWLAAWLHHFAEDLRTRNYRSLGRATLVVRTLRPALQHSLLMLLHGRSVALRRLHAELLD